jgi:hypothetical protein
MPGPENYLQWLSSWRVFVTAMLMLSFATQSALQLYERNIERLSWLWPSCWHLIVLADDKCRAEHLERLRRRQGADIVRGVPAPPDFSAAAPWSCVLRLAAAHTAFWDEQVRHPGAAWMAAGGRGAPTAPEEEVARSHIPGGLAAIVAASGFALPPPIVHMMFYAYDENASGTLSFVSFARPAEAPRRTQQPRPTAPRNPPRRAPSATLLTIPRRPQTARASRRTSTFKSTAS